MSKHDDALADLEAFIADFGGSLPAGSEDGVAFAALELGALGVDAPIGGSRFGGCPDVAEGFAWPEARGVTGSPILEESLDPARIEAWCASPEHARSGRRMVFLAQIAWGDVSWSDPDLPASGRAYLFVGLAAEAGLDVAVVHDDSEVSALRPLQSGSGKMLDWSIGTNGMVSSRALHMRPRMSPNTGDDILLAALARRSAAVRVRGEQPRLERDVTHLAEQALGGNDWMLLFRVNSVPECGVQFQTYGNTTLAIAIRRSDLQRRDFSSVFSHLVGQLPRSSSPTAPPFTSGMAGLWKTPLRTGATDQAIAATQARLGFRLPASYVALMKQSNGGLPDREFGPDEPGALPLRCRRTQSHRGPS